MGTGTVFVGASDLFEGPLGVVKIGFKGFDLGKTTSDAILSVEQDVKDIIYQQDGTKPADHVRTGIDLMLAVTFGEISTGLLALLQAGITTQNATPTEDSGTMDRNIYQSMRDNEAGVLRVTAVDENGAAQTDLEHLLNFYEAIAIVDGELINWGNDTQRNLPVTFRIKWHAMTALESTTKSGAFGYWGDPTIEDVPPVVWADVAAPVIVSAIASAAVTLDVVFDENIAFQTVFQAESWIAKVNGLYVAPTAGVITTTAIALTFAAATFTAGDVIELSIGSVELEDMETTPNAYAGVDGYSVTNSV